MTPGMQRMNTIALLIAVVLLIIFLVLHNKPARAQEVNCQLVTVAYPKMQISMVSKQCWIIPAGAIETPPLPRAKPCKMKGRVRIDGECWIPRRVKLMHKRK